MPKAICVLSGVEIDTDFCKTEHRDTNRMSAQTPYRQ